MRGPLVRLGPWLSTEDLICLSPPGGDLFTMDGRGLSQEYVSHRDPTVLGLQQSPADDRQRPLVRLVVRR
jgi:hypothetical protein